MSSLDFDSDARFVFDFVPRDAPAGFFIVSSDGHVGGQGCPPHPRCGPSHYDRFIVIKKMPFVSVFSSRFRSSSTASTGFISLSTRRSM